jgi:aryl-alcohol dehydrogenase-like predicted oxidoreductase
MKTRKLGATDLHFSTVGMGTWPMGGVSAGMHWGPQDDKDSVDTILRAVELGVNWLDTAGAYGRGHAEEVVGMALKKLPKNSLIITTKCGGTAEDTMEPKSVRATCEASMKRMGLDVLDVYLTHWPRPAEYMEAGWQTMADLVKEGKVRYIGVSNYTVEQMEKLQAIHPIALMEPPYSMITRGIEDAILDYCRYRSMGVVCYSPLQQGVLTENLKDLAFAEGDFRANNPNFKEPVLSLNLKLIEELKPIAKKYDASVAQLAIAWVLRRPEVTSALNGARVKSEIEDSAKAMDVELKQDDIDTIEKLLEKRRRALPPPTPRAGPPGGGRPGGGPPGGGPPGGGPPGGGPPGGGPPGGGPPGGGPPGGGPPGGGPPRRP